MQKCAPRFLGSNSDKLADPAFDGIAIRFRSPNVIDSSTITRYKRARAMQWILRDGAARGALVL